MVRAGLEEQLEVQTASVDSLRRRVTNLDGVQEKWEAEQERVKVKISYFFSCLSHPTSPSPPSLSLSLNLSPHLSPLSPLSPRLPSLSPCLPSLSLSLYQELQHKLKQVRHDIQFAEMVQSRVLHSEEMERELRQLREENTALREHTDNVGLMRYQLETLREQVQRSDDMEKKAVRLGEENKLLREELAAIEEGTGRVGGR